MRQVNGLTVSAGGKYWGERKERHILDSFTVKSG